MKELEVYKRKAVFCNLKEYDFSCKEHSYIEITEWHNGEGIDINVNNYSDWIDKFYTKYLYIFSIKKTPSQGKCFCFD